MVEIDLVIDKHWKVEKIVWIFSQCGVESLHSKWAGLKQCEIHIDCDKNREWFVQIPSQKNEIPFLIVWVSSHFVFHF